MSDNIQFILVCTNTGGGGGDGLVDSVFSRIGNVTALDGDYTKSMIPGLKDTDTPTFQGIVIDSLSGLLKATAGAVQPAVPGDDYVAAMTIGDLTEATSNVLIITGGAASVIGDGLSIQVRRSSGTVSGYLHSDDFAAFAAKVGLIHAHNSGNGNQIAYADISGTPSSMTPTSHAASHISGGADSIKLDDLGAPDDNTDLNASTTRHGLMAKLSGDSEQYFNGMGQWVTPSGAGDVQSNTDVSVNSELVLFSGTSGKVIKRAAITGILKLTAGVASEATAGTDYEPPVSKGNLTELTSNVLTISGGSGSVIGSGVTITVKQASGTVSGYLSSSDFAAFAAKVGLVHVHSAANGNQVSYLNLSDVPSTFTPSTHSHTISYLDLTNVPSTFAPSSHAANHATGGADPIKLDDLATPDDNTDLNASITKHGLMPKLSGDAGQYFNGVGGWTSPSSSGITAAQARRIALVYG